MSAILLLIALLVAGHIETGEACKQKIDLLFVIDGSSTVCDGPRACKNWEYNLQFVKDIADSLTIGTCDSNVAAFTFSDYAMVEWTLNTYTDKPTLLSAIVSINFPGGEFSDLASAGTIVPYIFNATTGDRLDAPNIIILITDGVPGITTDQAMQASEMTQEAGVMQFVVCITTGCTEIWAKATASQPIKPGQKTYFIVDNYSLLHSIKHEVLKNICAF